MIIAEKKKNDKSNPIYIRLDKKDKQACEMILEQMQYILKKNKCEDINVTFSKVVELLIKTNYMSNKNVLLVNDNLFTIDMINEIYRDDFANKILDFYRLNSNIILKKLKKLFEDSLIEDILKFEENSMLNYIEDIADNENIDQEYDIKILSEQLNFLKDILSTAKNLEDKNNRKKLITNCKKYEEKYNESNFFGDDEKYSIKDMLLNFMKEHIVKNEFEDFKCILNYKINRFNEILDLDFFKETLSLAEILKININNMISLYVEMEFSIDCDEEQYKKNSKLLNDYLQNNFNKK